MKRLLLLVLINCVPGFILADMGSIMSLGDGFSRGQVYVIEEDPDISMDKEFLYLDNSLRQLDVHVRFQFTNTGKTKRVVDCGFPLDNYISIDKSQSFREGAETPLINLLGKNATDVVLRLEPKYLAMKTLDQVLSNLRFPLGTPGKWTSGEGRFLFTPGAMKKLGIPDPVKAFPVKLDGKMVTITGLLVERTRIQGNRLQPGGGSYYNADSNSLQIRVNWLFSVDFQSKQTRRVDVDYKTVNSGDGREGHGITQLSTTSDYFLGTGRTWKGPIGTLVIWAPGGSLNGKPFSYLPSVMVDYEPPRDAQITFSKSYVHRDSIASEADDLSRMGEAPKVLKSRPWTTTSLNLPDPFGVKSPALFKKSIYLYPDAERRLSLVPDAKAAFDDDFMTPFLPAEGPFSLTFKTPLPLYRIRAFAGTDFISSAAKYSRPESDFDSLSLEYGAFERSGEGTLSLGTLKVPFPIMRSSPVTGDSDVYQEKPWVTVNGPIGRYTLEIVPKEGGREERGALAISEIQLDLARPLPPEVEDDPFFKSTMAPLGFYHSSVLPKPIKTLPYNFPGVISQDTVRFRSGPTLNDEILGLFKKDEQVQILEKTEATETIGTMTAPWYKVRRTDGTTCWVFGGFVELERG